MLMAARPCTFDTNFPHDWQAQILEWPPLIVPSQHFIYPQAVEEVELGALQILFRSMPSSARPETTQAMATFALGFADPSLPHGLWSCPNPQEICAIAGGYAYIVKADQPAQWMQVPYRPVTAVHVALERQLLIFASFHTFWALGANGKVWETAQLSWEGLRVTAVYPEQLEGFGWDLETDAEVPFTVNLTTGSHTGGAGAGPAK